MEVYMDDMLVKSKEARSHVEDLEETFAVLRKYRLKLNPGKCAFGVSGGCFLGFIVTQRGIKVNRAKIKAILDMGPPTSINEVQRLTGKMPALSRFISKSAEKGLSFFKTLRKVKDFKLTEECQQAFEELKAYLAKLPLLVKPIPGNTLYLYMSSMSQTISSALDGPGPGYHDKEIASVLPFLSHWSQNQHFLEVLADFVFEMIGTTQAEAPEENPWLLHVDGSSTAQGSSASIVITSPQGEDMEFAIKFDFNASNNETEYEALVLGMRMA
ncbi:UNVERIFIED_CONTAM: Retrotransposon-like protein 1 [Sesamum calycinum]|uniref:Retrotransposon-like protein 1 n=1 Tax=Sesamum calycinum TaxID=2727403 RepID=A0AAW2MSF1_9LAMI